MKYWLLFISSLISLSLWAQDTDSLSSSSTDTLQWIQEIPAQGDSLSTPSQVIQSEEEEEVSFFENRTVFTPQVYIDYGKLITTAAGLENKMEGAFSLLFFDAFELIGEAGMATLKPEHAYTNGNYESSGRYYRVGGGYISKINAKSNIGLGVRYGQSLFEDQGKIEIQSASGLQDDYISTFNRNDLTARWWEMVLTSESRLILNKNNPDSRLNQMISLGFFFRVRFLVAHENTMDKYEVDVYSIPGYGSTVNKQQLAFNLFVKFTPW
ncbi:DUF6048 family protein [Marinoscillum sp. MHG1-6]|uniref:DUF6048 family protein n=1 Tax=Marinoscillum sp. MHG1-6 TaxID=2959627 RepID=UPI002157EA1F|nr:DUF6048 family protein [Marinoscillum sp. MHG1-6]